MRTHALELVTRIDSRTPLSVNPQVAEAEEAATSAAGTRSGNRSGAASCSIRCASRNSVVLPRLVVHCAGRRRSAPTITSPELSPHAEQRTEGPAAPQLLERSARSSAAEVKDAGVALPACVVLVRDRAPKSAMMPSPVYCFPVPSSGARRR